MKKELITHRIPKSPISEIFRTLRTNLQFMNTKEGLRTLMVTSCNQSEGKSWITSNLAVAFAQTGKKVLLIDCDLRKGRQFSIFGVKPTPGISNFLSGIDSNGYECSENVFDVIQKTPVENLDILTAGNVPPNPSELLVSERMQKCIRTLKNHYDLLVFDTTPSNLVTDAVIISRYVDTSIIVVEHKGTKMEDLKRIKRDIENVGGKIAGVVVNKVPISTKRYTDAYYYYGNSSGDVKLKDVKRKDKNKIVSTKYEEEQEENDYIEDNEDEKEKEDTLQKRDQEKDYIVNTKNNNIQEQPKVAKDDDDYEDRVYDDIKKSVSDIDKKADKKDKELKEKTKSTREAAMNRQRDILNIINRYAEENENGD